MPRGYRMYRVTFSQGWVDVERVPRTPYDPESRWFPDGVFIARWYARSAEDALRNASGYYQRIQNEAERERIECRPT